MKNLEIKDSLSLSKREQRMRGLAGQDHQDIVEKRKEMWRHRVEKIWGLKNEK